jgi:hypothetical protein
MILPVPETLKRFLAPECVFTLGMIKNLAVFKKRLQRYVFFSIFYIFLKIKKGNSPFI